MVNFVVIATGIGLLLLLALAVLGPIWGAFARELKYVNMKILNSRHDKELAYWENRKKRLWKSLLLFQRYRNDHHHHDQNSDQ